MRVITKYTGALLVGICGVLVVSAADNYRREVAFFEHDMRLDHFVVGDAVAAMVGATWRHDGKAAAREAPRQMVGGERQLEMHVIDPAVPDGEWQTVDANTRARLAAREPVSARQVGWQRTLVPIAGPQGESLVLVVREPLEDEDVFSRGSWWRTVVVTLVVVALCSGAAFASGYVWVERPIRALCERARAIGRGDLEQPVSLAGSDEFALLARELDAMRDSLRGAKAAVLAETEQRIATLEQLRHADRLATVGRLASGVAHELGTPLNVVGETAKMIRRGELTGADLTDGASTIADQSQRMAAIIRQLLDFARPRAAVKQRTDVAELVERTLRLLETVAQKRGVELRQRAGAATHAALDPAQMQQVFTNLIVNAVQATPAGRAVEVEVHAVAATPPSEHGGAPGTWLCVEVRDPGHGIEPENMRRLFEPFFTTKGVGEGTGLGLSVSRGIVREHGGWIAVQSTPGRGSCFAVYLPLAAPEGGDDA